MAINLKDAQLGNSNLGLMTGGAAALEAAEAKAAKSRPSSKTNVTESVKRGGKIQLQDIPPGFDLTAARQVAYGRAVTYLNSVLAEKNMQVHLEGTDEKIGIMTRTDSPEEVGRYEGSELLRIYATTAGKNGVIVDGKV